MASTKGLTSRTATVYRVQDHEGNGPYDNALAWTDDGHLYSPIHPDPWDEGLDFETGIHFCGFESMDKLLEWFSDDELDCLEANGFEVIEFEVPLDQIQFGKRQLIFIKP